MKGLGFAEGTGVLLRVFAYQRLTTSEKGLYYPSPSFLICARTQVHASLYVHMCVCIHVHPHQDVYNLFICIPFCVRAYASKHPCGFRDTSCFPVHWIECHPKRTKQSENTKKLRQVQVRIRRIPKDYPESFEYFKARFIRFAFIPFHVNMY